MLWWRLHVRSFESPPPPFSRNPCPSVPIRDAKWQTAKANIHLKTTGITSKETKVVVEDVVGLKKRSELGLTLAEDLADSSFTLWGDLPCAFLWRHDGGHLGLQWHRTCWWIMYDAANVEQIKQRKLLQDHRNVWKPAAGLLCCPKSIVGVIDLGPSGCFSCRFEIKQLLLRNTSAHLQISVKSQHVWRFLGITGHTSSTFQNSKYNCKAPQQPPFFLPSSSRWFRASTMPNILERRPLTCL